MLRERDKHRLYAAVQVARAKYGVHASVVRHESRSSLELAMV